MSDDYTVNETEHPEGTIVNDKTITTKGVPDHLRVDSGDLALPATTFSDRRETTRAPYQGRKLNLKPIERHADPRGGEGAPARHGNVLDGGKPDPNRATLAVESTGSSIGRTLFSDSADAGITIEGQRSANAIATEREKRGVVAAYERTEERIAEEQRKREAETYEERVAKLRRRTPESLVQRDENQVFGPRVAPRPKA